MADLGYPEVHLTPVHSAAVVVVPVAVPDAVPVAVPVVVPLAVPLAVPADIPAAVAAALAAVAVLTFAAALTVRARAASSAKQIVPHVPPASLPQYTHPPGCHGDDNLLALVSFHLRRVSPKQVVESGSVPSFWNVPLSYHEAAVDIPPPAAVPVTPPVLVGLPLTKVTVLV